MDSRQSQTSSNNVPFQSQIMCLYRLIFTCYIDIMISSDSAIEIILTTHDDLQQAQDLARLLVDQRAAACVNLVPNLVSVFRWENATRVEDEILLLIKTTAGRSQRVQTLIKRHHTYDIPEIIRLDGEVLHKPYMEWLLDCLG